LDAKILFLTFFVVLFGERPDMDALKKAESFASMQVFHHQHGLPREETGFNTSEAGKLGL
jgi:hypothetical protein